MHGYAAYGTPVFAFSLSSFAVRRTNDHRLWRDYVRDGIDEDLICSMSYLKGLLRTLNLDGTEQGRL